MGRAREAGGVSDPVAPRRHVRCWHTFEVSEGTELALQVAPATTAGTLVTEALTVTIDGDDAVTVREIAVDHGGRVHLLGSRAGTLRIAYQAELAPVPAVVGDVVLLDPLVTDGEAVAAAGAGAGADADADAESGPDPAGSGEPDAEADGPGGAAADGTGETFATDLDVLEALRPSPYGRSDALNGFARAEFAAHLGSPDLAHRVARWVFGRIAYTPGSSGPLDGAVDTLQANAGVCRDFAHLTIGLCRALSIPARLVAVYAPGLSPMDFHAVVEVRTAAGWEVLDATRLAPRQSLVRIATGRDAADTAFASTVRGNAELIATEVVAYVDGDLPLDDHARSIQLP